MNGEGRRRGLVRLIATGIVGVGALFALPTNAQAAVSCTFLGGVMQVDVSGGGAQTVSFVRGTGGSSNSVLLKNGSVSSGSNVNCDDPATSTVSSINVDDTTPGGQTTVGDLPRERRLRARRAERSRWVRARSSSISTSAMATTSSRSPAAPIPPTTTPGWAPSSVATKAST